MSASSEDGMAKALRALKRFDRDGDGAITENDFLTIARELGHGDINEDLVRGAFKRADKNQNGKLDTNEIIDLLKFVRNLAAKYPKPNKQ